jgi:fluoride exporter
MAAPPLTVGHAPAQWWAIAAGGAVGTAARAGLLWVWPAAHGDWPTTVFVENVAGAFLLGALLGWLGRREGAARWRSPFFGSGALGSFTTFSTLAVDVATLGADRPWWGAAYALASVAAGLGAALAGWSIGRRA